tara:strand:+ start:13677 stop:13892 length:216 start_codon:yes stop_codon:yes gene_type:complete
LNEDTNKIVSRDWELVAKGTRMTKEFAAFLKHCIDTTPASCKIWGLPFKPNIPSGHKKAKGPSLTRLGETH